MNTAPESRRIYRLDELSATFRMSRNAIHRAMTDEGFPQPIKLSSRSKGWWRHEVEEWFANRPRGIAPCVGADQRQSA